MTITGKNKPFDGYASWQDRPFDNRSSEICVYRESDGTAPSVIVCIQNPDYVPLAQRKERPLYQDIVPTDDFKPKTSAQYHQILIRAGVTTFSGDADSEQSSDSVAETDNNTRTFMPVRPNDTNIACQIDTSDCNTRTQIYALEIYNIPIADFTKSKLLKAAKAHLKINSTSFIPLVIRELNFDQFARERFHRVPKEEEEFEAANEQVFKTNTKAYDNLKKYALTDYGAIMIQRINNSDTTFTIYSAPDTQASGYTDFIKLPPGYPRLYAYPFSSQVIDPQATIHHEFEHTGFGSSTLPIGSLAEEVQAVIQYENPARIIDGYEPRYVYYQSATDTTINVLNNETLAGGKTFDSKDPRILK